MQKTKPMKLLRRYFQKLLFFILLVYSGSAFIITIFETPAEPLTFPFYFLLPGHAFVELAFPKVPKVEKIIASIGFSIVFLVALNALIQVFAVTTLFSELTLVTIIAAILLIAKLVMKNGLA